MSKFMIPAENPEQWKQLLAEPDKQWKTGYSAKSLAYCWQEANGFPYEVKKAFRSSGINLFNNAEIVVAFPEYKVPLPGGRRASQSDIFILAKGNEQLISIMVEGKVNEPFGETVIEWKAKEGKGRKPRLRYLCDLLGLNNDEVDSIRYQLLHRTASALIEAKKLNAPNALMLVHSFSKDNMWFDDYCKFLALFGVKGVVGSLVLGKNIDDVDLYFGWVKGDSKYLEV
jgi:hypothetical protein